MTASSRNRGHKARCGRRNCTNCDGWCPNPKKISQKPWLGPMDDVCFNNSVGVSDQKKISHEQMTASSRSRGHKARRGRLSCTNCDGWCPNPKKISEKPWLQINFTKSFQVCGVATQGDRHGTKWTTEFTLSFSNDGCEWSCYKNDDGEEMVRDKNVAFNARVTTGIA